MTFSALKQATIIELSFENVDLFTTLGAYVSSKNNKEEDEKPGNKSMIHLKPITKFMLNVFK